MCPTRTTRSFHERALPCAQSRVSPRGLFRSRDVSDSLHLCVKLTHMRSGRMRCIRTLGARPSACNRGSNGRAFQAPARHTVGFDVLSAWLQGNANATQTQKPHVGQDEARHRPKISCVYSPLPNDLRVNIPKHADNVPKKGPCSDLRAVEAQETPRERIREGPPGGLSNCNFRTFFPSERAYLSAIAKKVRP
jgi:hypothetical protein